MVRQSSVLVFIAALLVGSVSSGFANQTVTLKPGSKVIIDSGPTTVICSEPEDPPFARYCRCSPQGLSGQIVLQIILDPMGTVDDLGIYDSDGLCQKSLHNNPACGK